MGGRRDWELTSDSFLGCVLVMELGFLLLLLELWSLGYYSVISAGELKS